MKLPDLPFTVTDWKNVSPEMVPGETGTSTWRVFQADDLRVRIVEYGPDYLADHWCDRGHVLYVLDGQLQVQMKDGRSFEIKAGQSLQVSDFGDAAHRVYAEHTCRVFIVD